MERYGPIHPEHPVGRTVVAVAISLVVHAAAIAALVAWALAVLAAARKAEAERPKEVSLSRLDAGQWEANRRLVERPPPFERPRSSERPAKGIPGQRPVDGEDERLLPGSSPEGWAAAEGAEAPAPTFDPGAPAPVGPTLDLRPRPMAGQPLDLGVRSTGEGGRAYADTDALGGVKLLHPEAWRYAIFTDRLNEGLNAAYRYRLGSPIPLSARTLRSASRNLVVFTVWISVVIDRDGRLRDSRVRRSSGSPDVDEMLLAVVRATAPLPNFPSGLLGDDGLYSDSWGIDFILW